MADSALEAQHPRAVVRHHPQRIPQGWAPARSSTARWRPCARHSLKKARPHHRPKKARERRVPAAFAATLPKAAPAFLAALCDFFLGAASWPASAGPSRRGHRRAPWRSWNARACGQPGCQVCSTRTQACSLLTSAHLAGSRAARAARGRPRARRGGWKSWVGWRGTGAPGRSRRRTLLRHRTGERCLWENSGPRRQQGARCAPASDVARPTQQGGRGTHLAQQLVPASVGCHSRVCWGRGPWKQLLLQAPLPAAPSQQALGLRLGWGWGWGGVPGSVCGA